MSSTYKHARTSADAATAQLMKSRWGIAVAGVAIQVMLGTVYAWSIFKKPIMNVHGWPEFQVGITFALTIFFLGLSAAIGGRLVDRAGSRTIATIAGVLFGCGTLLAGVAHQFGCIALLWLGYGVIAGTGNGLGYVTPVAVLVRWFPDRKGLITGLAVMGFGLGAAFMSLIGERMIHVFGNNVGVYGTFYACGVAFLIGLPLAARWLVNPPESFAPPISSKMTARQSAMSQTLGSAVRMPQLYILWAILFLNVAAGIALLSNLAPMALAKQSIARDTGVASLIVILGSFCNGFGRLFWGGLSERLGRRNVFLLIFLTQIPLFLLLPHLQSFLLFTLAACYIMLCYGGGFGTMPSFTADTFGPKNIGAIYGVVLFAWGLAGGFGPMLMEWVKKSTQRYDTALYIAAGILAVGVVATLLYRKPEAAIADQGPSVMHAGQGDNSPPEA